jgi:glycolate oxidase iron-sulfur subunit
VETFDEADSPRGRILLMKAMADGRAEPSDIAFEHLDRCLVCRACEPACPSGVNYHEILETVRPRVAEAVLGPGRHMRSAALQWLVGKVLPFPKRAAAAMMPLKIARKLGLGGVAERLAPGPLREAMHMIPRQPGGAELPAFTPAKGLQRGSAVLLRGCVGGLVSHAVNAASVRVLAANGLDVHLLAEESCCGALPAHANDPAGARDFAMRLVETLAARDADYFVSPIAGCGAQLKALDHVLGDSETYAGKARGVVKRMRDISELLAELGAQAPARRLERRVAYHDPCHLAHAQRITAAPRQLLALVPGLTVVPLAESDMCCGAAGSYSLNQPEMAARLGRRKARQVAASGAVELVTANIGCTLQIARHLKEAGTDVPVRHVVEVLDEAYGNAAGNSRSDA